MRGQQNIKALERERQAVVDYMAMSDADERVEALEKVKSERVLGRQIDAWDVHTNRDRWWVLTSPMNLYSQKQFPSLEVAISFHVGLMARVMERSDRTSRPEQAARFTRAWRTWEGAANALDEADEAEEFQSIGMRCRESLLAFVREAASAAPVAAKQPKAGDFVGWSELLANTIASGDSAERRRGYLKAIAKSTWELVSWLTHSASETRSDAHFALEATEHALGTWSLAILRHEVGVPERCPNCSSYRLTSCSHPIGKGAVKHFTVCDVCDWESDPEHKHTRERRPGRKRRPRKPTTPCVFVDVPLRGEPPPSPISIYTPRRPRRANKSAARSRR